MSSGLNMRIGYTGFMYILWIVGIMHSVAFAQQPFQFALVTDTHVGGATGAEDLRRTVADLNQRIDIDFVVLSGDVTEFGSDEELRLAKQILDSLQKPLYIIPGNHDSNWSESGANSFRQVFGGETFFFEHKGYQFMGTTSGPNMRMSPGQIPRENLVWMDSIFRVYTDNPLVFINHYPLDSSLNNWFEAIDRLKTRNIRLALCGHGHQNRLYDWEGIPGVMNRSNLRAKEAVGGYNIIHLTRDSAFFRVRRPLERTENVWLKIPLGLNNVMPEQPKRPDYTVNSTYGRRVLWEYRDHGDIGSGMDTDGRFIFAANTVGEIYALDIHDGRRVWSFKTGGKVYSTPAYAKGVVVVGSSDHGIYGLDAKTGMLLWKVKTSKAVLGSPVIDGDKVYIGGSDGTFRCLDLRDGRLVWAFDSVKGYVSARPTLVGNKVIFGSWENGFYALDKRTGNVIWEWDNGYSNRMFSAAACYPVVTNGRVFIVAPDRYMTALDLKSGKVVWREKKEGIRVRESIGLAPNGKYVYAKTMDGELIGVSVHKDSMSIDWHSALKLPYDISPTAIVSSSDLTFVPSHSGLLSAVDPKTGQVRWQYRIAAGMVNPPLVWKHSVFVSTMDGKIVALRI